MKLADVVPADLPDSALVGAQQVAEWLTVTIHTVYNWCKTGKLPQVKRLGRRSVRVNVGELRAALKKMDRQEANAARS